MIRLNLTNQQFGRLVALRMTDERKGRCIVWECRCICGATVLIPSNRLRAGMTKSCGCLLSEHRHRLGLTYGLINGKRAAPAFRKMILHALSKKGAQVKHYKAGSANRAKALLKRLAL